MQLTDKDGNVFGTGGLEITTSDGKPKIPVINTDITIGVTSIVGGVAGRLLFEGAGNVVQESANLSWDNASNILTLGSTATRIFNFRPEDTTGAYGNSCSIRGGNGNGRLDFYSASNITEVRDNIILLTSVGGPSIQVGPSAISLNVASSTRLQVAPTTGNIQIGTTTDAGFKLDVNGTARVRGTGTTNATTAFTVTNSAATYNSLIIRDDGTFVFGNPNNGVAYLTAASNGNITATYFNASLDLGAGRKVTSVQYFSSGSITASSALAQGVYFNNTLVASANNDVLVGLDVLPTFTNGAFTGVSNFAARFGSDVTFTARNSSISVQRPATQANGFSLTVSAGGATTQGTGGSLYLLAGSGTGGPGSGQVVIGNDTSTYNNIILRGYTYVTSTGPNQGTAFAVFAGGQTGISIYWDNPAAFMQYGLVSGRQARFVNSSSYTFSSKVFIGTNTDAGYNFDVNGTARIQGNTTLTGTLTMGNGSFSYSANPNDWFTISGNQGLILNQANGNIGSIVLGASNSANFTVALTNTTMYGVSISRPVTPIAGSTNLTYNSLEIDNVINYTNATNSIVRGLYIHPTLTAVTDFRAIETTVGNVLFGTTSGNVGIGTTNPTSKLYLDGGIFTKKYYTDTSNNTVSFGSGYELFGTLHSAAGYSFYIYPAGWNSGWDVKIGDTSNNFSFSSTGGFGANKITTGELTLGGGVISYYKLSPASGFSFTSANGWDFVLRGTSDEKFRVKGNGNFLINTTTDAGYKLDINGSARVQSGLTVSGSLNLNSSDISSAWTAYTPTWSTDGATQPSLGNGTITGAYKVIGKTVFVRVRLVFGTTTTAGTGTFYFSLPVNAAAAWGVQMPVSILDNGNAWYQATVNGEYGGLTDKVALITQSAGGANSSQGVTGVFPITFGNTDSLQFNGSYESV